MGDSDVQLELRATGLPNAIHGITHWVLKDLLSRGKRHLRELINTDGIKCQRDINVEITGK